MNNIMRYIILIFLFIILLPITICLILLFVFEFKIVDPDTYITALQENNGYALIKEQVNQLIGFQLSDEYVKEQTDNLIYNSFDYLNGKTEKPDLKIDTRPVKRQLAGEFEGGLLSLIPDSVDITERLPAVQMMPEIKSNVKLARKSFYIASILFLLLIFISYIVCATIKGWLRFTGSLLGISGGILYASFLIVPGMASSIPTGDNPAAAQLVKSAVENIAGFGSTLAAIILGLGLVFLIASIFAGKHKKAMPEKRKIKPRIPKKI